MRPSISPGLEQVRAFLRQQSTQTSAPFAEFETAISRAKEIFDAMPAEIRHHAFRSVRPTNYGEDLRAALFGIIDEELNFLETIRVTYGHKINELAAGICEGFSPQRFRIAVLSCRALYEEAAAAKYYGDQATAAVADLVSTPPTAFRLQRLKNTANSNREGFKGLLERTSSPGKVLKRWYGVRKIDWRKADYFKDHKLDEKDPLFPGFFLSALKTIKWQNDIPASYFYAVLCEATHPNVLSNTLYVDDASGSDSRQLIYLIRKNPTTIEPFVTLYEYVSVPTVECVKIIDEYLGKITNLKDELGKYAEKARRMSA